MSHTLPTKTREDVFTISTCRFPRNLQNAEVSVVRRYSCVYLILGVCVFVCAYVFVCVLGEGSVLKLYLRAHPFICTTQEGVGEGEGFQQGWRRR